MADLTDSHLELNPQKLKQSMTDRNKEKQYSVTEPKRHDQQILLRQNGSVDLEEKVNNCILFTKQIDGYKFPDIKFEQTDDNFISNSLWLCSNMTKNIVKFDSKMMEQRILFGIELSYELSLRDGFNQFMIHFWNNFDGYIDMKDQGELDLHKESNKITKVTLHCFIYTYFDCFIYQIYTYFDCFIYTYRIFTTSFWKNMALLIPNTLILQNITIYYGIVVGIKWKLTIPY